ncbi:MAG: peptide-methionine (S)-S-oxide reductase MsrA [Myxococcota bacterium]|nr:peptide-methionine (S)-S-oxide reductase MsrA [Myxococcota bacterium]
MWFLTKKAEMVSEASALPGRQTEMPRPAIHFVNQNPISGPWPESMQSVVLGLGCFWGAERKFWTMAGVYTTAVGYSAGYTPNPTYEEVCSGQTGHNEVVLVVYDPDSVSFDAILRTFWESHAPTQGMRQGIDVGTQSRSGIYTTSDDQLRAAKASLVSYQERLSAAGYGVITTEVQSAEAFYYAESYHQQYLAKNPNGYCGLGGTGVSCPIGTGTQARDH